MRFVKMHGLGNDFIAVDDRELSYRGGAEGAVSLCNRRLGIGADGLLLFRRSDVADIQMFLYNSDGSVAEMCGNGIRCFAKYAYENGLVKKRVMTIETLAGIKTAELSTDDSGLVAAVRVDMGVPLFDRRNIPMTGEGECSLESIRVLDRDLVFSGVNTGVPHAAVFVDGDFTEEEIQKYGPAMESHPLFPQKVNVNFVQVKDGSTIAVRTWERGCGRTLACGTGSCAAAVCCARAGYTGRRVKVELAHGCLDIDWAEDGRIFMSGPAKAVFEGETEEY